MWCPSCKYVSESTRAGRCPQCGGQGIVLDDRTSPYAPAKDFDKPVRNYRIKRVKYADFRAAVALDRLGQCIGWKRLTPGSERQEAAAMRLEIERK